MIFILLVSVSLGYLISSITAWLSFEFMNGEKLLFVHPKVSYLKLHAFYEMLLCNFLWNLLPFVKQVKGNTEYILFIALTLWEEIFLGSLRDFFTISEGKTKSGNFVSNESEMRNTSYYGKFSVIKIVHVLVILKDVSLFSDH